MGVQACGCACALNNCAEVNRGADSPAAAAAVTRLGWKLGAWRRKLGARTRNRIRIRVRRGTTSSTLTSSLSSHRNAALSQICALNRIRASKAARVRRRETEAEGLKSDLTLPQR